MAAFDFAGGFRRMAPWQLVWREVSLDSRDRCVCGVAADC